MQYFKIVECLDSFFLLEVLYIGLMVCDFRGSPIGTVLCNDDMIFYSDRKQSFVNFNDIQSAFEVISQLKIDGDKSSLIGIICEPSQCVRLVSFVGVRFWVGSQFISHH